MLRRSAASAFAPDAYVFPGGTIDPQDEQPEALNRMAGITEDWLRAQFRSADSTLFPSRIAETTLEEAAALSRAALRELFEEAGVLLACDVDGQPAAARITESERNDVQRGSLTFAELLLRHNVYGDVRALTFFSQWITPPSEPRRYNTHFFLARGSQLHEPLADAFETHDGLWIRPSDALERSRQNGFRLVYPTVKHLERLAEFDDIDELFTFARSKPVYRIMPEDSAGENRFALPAELERAW